MEKCGACEDFKVSRQSFMHLSAPGKRGCRREVKFIPAQRGKVSWLVYQYDGRTTAKVNTMLFSSWKALTEAVLLQYSYILGTGQRGERGVTSQIVLKFGTMLRRQPIRGQV